MPMRPALRWRMSFCRVCVNVGEHIPASLWTNALMATRIFGPMPTITRIIVSDDSGLWIKKLPTYAAFRFSSFTSVITRRRIWPTLGRQHKKKGGTLLVPRSASDECPKSGFPPTYVFVNLQTVPVQLGGSGKIMAAPRKTNTDVISEITRTCS